MFANFRQAMTWLQSRWMGNPPLSSQAIMADLLEHLSPDERRGIANYYASNATLLFQGLGELGVQCVPAPKGGFFTLMDASALLSKPMPDSASCFKTKTSTLENDWDIALALLAGFGQDDKQGIALMPASCFGIDPVKGWIRVSFSIPTDEITLMLKRFKRVFG